MKYAVVVLAFILMFAVPQVWAAATPRIEGMVLVVWSDSAGYRTDTVAVGIEQALSELPGVTVAVPKSRRPWRLSDADLNGIAYVVEIYQSEIVSREDRREDLWFQGTGAYRLITTVRVRLGLRFLAVTPNSAYLRFHGSAYADGVSSGITYLYGSTFRFGVSGSYSISTYQQLEIDAFRSATFTIFSGLGWR